MKKIRYILLSVLIFSSLIVKAGRYDIHMVDIWGGAGYSALLNSNEYGKMLGAGGGLIGVGYEYQNRSFMLSVGPEFRIFSSADNVLFENAPSNPYGVKGLEYLSMTKYYDFSAFKENQVVGQIMLPVMAGMKFEYWYFMAGFKVGYTLFDNYSQKGTLKTTISDEMAYDPSWENLYSHNIQTSPYSAKGKNKFGLDATLSAEVGVNINDFMSEEWNKQNTEKTMPLHMRAALFVDYGLLNMNIHDDVAMVSADAHAAKTISFHQSEWSAGRLNSFMIGLKFTASLQLNKPKGKKQPNPRMAIYVDDKHTGEPLSASISIYSQRTKRTTNKSTNAKGYFVTRYAPGDYTVSSRKSGYIESDTYKVAHAGDLQDTLHISLIPEPILTFMVKDAKSSRPISATLEFVNINNGQTEFTLQTDSLKEGRGSVKLKYGNNYKVNISANDYLTNNYNIDDLYADMQFSLQPVEKGRKYVIRNLFFATNETTILPESEESLQEIYEFLKDNKDVRIRIIGHTDSVGSDEDNQKLSEGRANSVKANIVERGISEDRIEAIGKGESEPIDTNDTEEGRAQNRRVEFEIL